MAAQNCLLKATSFLMFLLRRSKDPKDGQSTLLAGLFVIDKEIHDIVALFEHTLLT